MFPEYQLCWELLLWTNVGFCQKCFLCIYWDDNVIFILCFVNVIIIKFLYIDLNLLVLNWLSFEFKHILKGLYFLPLQPHFVFDVILHIFMSIPQLFIVAIVDFCNFCLLTFMLTYLSVWVIAITIYLPLPVEFFPSYIFLFFTYNLFFFF